MEVTHLAHEQTFAVTLDGYNAELTYARSQPDVVDFQHTWVDEELRGRGVADALAATALNWAKESGFKILTTCKFMRAYVNRHPEWEALRAG